MEMRLFFAECTEELPLASLNMPIAETMPYGEINAGQRKNTAKNGMAIKNDAKTTWTS
ncbi:MAG: hypothetical protein FWG04_02345 [Desulfovibrionaceae bacterium]|nr:hypothetical protein [Desulfovibrionaceae bacterium]